MFVLASLRVGARHVFTASALTGTAGVTSRWVSNTLTRSFVTSVARAEPARAKPETATKTKKSTPKNKAAKTTAKETVEAEAETKVKKKPVKKAKKSNKVTIPVGTRIPPYGPKAYTYFMTKVFEPELPWSKENFAANGKAAGAAWKALPESEKQKYHEICTVLCVKAKAERQAYINSLNPTILRELNRRRVAKGKPKIHRKGGQVPNAFLRWSQEYRKTHSESVRLPNNQFAAHLGELWMGMSTEEKQPYFDQYNAEKARKNAQKEA